MVSIKTVAERAGVSISTVSNVINHKDNVSPERTARVLVAIKELGYHVDPFARSMKTGKSNTIGLVITDIGGMFYSYVIEALCNYLEMNHYHLTVIGTTMNHFISASEFAVNDMDFIIEKFRNLVQHRVSGIIFSSTFAESMEQALVDQILQTASSRNIPIVTIGSDFSQYGMDSVYSDSIDGGKKATAHLIKSGCKKIAHISGPLFRRAGRQRMEGYKQALADARVAVDQSLIIPGDYSHQSGYVAMMKLLNQTSDIDGVFCGNDQMAVGAMRAIHQRNLRIPEDIHIIGYDDLAIASILTPPLSTIHVRKKEMGTCAGEIMLKRISGEYSGPDPIVTRLDTKLIVRQSTSQNMPDDWIISDW